MTDPKAHVIIVENRRMIQDILVDVLEGQGFCCECVSSLANCLPLLAEQDHETVLLIDVGLLGGREATITALDRVPVLSQQKTVLFTCVESLGGPDVYSLRSPRDFSTIATVVEMQLTSVRPTRLGELLVEAGALAPSALQAVLAVQEELGKLNRQPPLGRLLVSLGFVSQDQVARALQAQGKSLTEDETAGIT